MAELLSELDRQAVVAGLQQTFDAQTSEVLLRAIERVVALHNGRELRQDLGELKQIVTSLAMSTQELVAAQARSEKRLQELLSLEKLMSHLLTIPRQIRSIDACP